MEPNPTGNGTVGASGSLKTSYAYNQSDELVTITQGDQTRSIKYDSLGRLIRQKLAEQTATINDAGTYDGSGPLLWSDAFGYDDRSNLEKRTDARGVKMTFSYEIRAGTVAQMNAIGYNVNGQVTSLTVAPGATNPHREDYTYDAHTGLLTNQTVTNTNSNAVLMDLNYGYERGNSKGNLNGKTGQLTSITDDVNRRCLKPKKLAV